MSVVFEIVGIVLGLTGWITAIITCALPMWKVTTFIDANIVTPQITWEGIWSSCVVQSTGQMQCKIYESMLVLPQDLEAARAMTVISIILGVVAPISFIMGSKCTNCMEDKALKVKVIIFSGFIFIIAGILQVIPVSRTANTINQDFYNPLTKYQKKLGASIYIGFTAAALLIIGGFLLCCTCPPQERNEERGFYDAEEDVSEISIVMYLQCEIEA